MSTESETYCDRCRTIVSWHNDDHDGKTCPRCHKPWRSKYQMISSEWGRKREEK